MLTKRRTYFVKKRNIKQRPSNCRRRRDLTNLLQVPGTYWCGISNSAKKYAELGGRSKADRCCRQHDSKCPLWIMGFETKYGLFNWRINTLMHCKCDDRYQSAKHGQNSSSVGRFLIFFSFFHCFFFYYIVFSLFFFPLFLQPFSLLLSPTCFIFLVENVYYPDALFFFSRLCCQHSVDFSRFKINSPNKRAIPDAGNEETAYNICKSVHLKMPNHRMLSMDVIVLSDSQLIVMRFEWIFPHANHMCF